MCSSGVVYLRIYVLKERNSNIIMQGPGKTSSEILHTILLNHESSS